MLTQFAVVSDLANAYNTIEWKDAIPFLICIIGLYWIKVKIDTRAGLGKKKSKELKKIIDQDLKRQFVQYKKYLEI